MSYAPRHRFVECPIMAISQDEREFFAGLGARVAHQRKEANITQVQLAETLGVSQQTINAYETGSRRIPVSALPRLAKVLSISIEQLLGESKTASKKRGPAPKLQQQVERLARLPKAQQRAVMQMLDGVLARAGSR
ncbi:MAG: helix-turn-helix domain-containing protein [Candidatus Methylophosphatis roskildensis]